MSSVLSPTVRHIRVLISQTTLSHSAEDLLHSLVEDTSL
jgi:hypothetical protein